MKCRLLRVLVLSLALLSLGVASLSASPALSSGSSQALSPDDRAAISSDILQMQVALQASSDKIAQQSRLVTTLCIVCGVEVVIDLGAVGLAWYEIIRK